MTQNLYGSMLNFGAIRVMGKKSKQRQRHFRTKCRRNHEWVKKKKKKRGQGHLQFNGFVPHDDVA